MSGANEFDDQTQTLAHPITVPQSFAGGRYAVKKLLGEGGQKYVVLARDSRLDRDVVVSIMKLGGSTTASNERLLREARALGRLGDHPNIVTVYDMGDERGLPYIVCQYVPGGSVSALLDRSEGRRLSLMQAIPIALQVCHALEHAHRAGIVHRDVKPSNIWLTESGTVKLGDFGLALRMESEQFTLQGMLVGTAAYISPEQGEGHAAEPASDLYALGIVFYEMLTGRRPFRGDNLVGIIWQHIHTPPVAPSWHNAEIPPQVESLILQLLAKAPADRPRSAQAVAETLAAIAGSQSAMAERVVQRSTSLSRVAPATFVGREGELQRLRSALHAASTSKGGLLMLVGDAGSGKTHTADQLATYARLHDFHVLQGRCYEDEGAPPFWPWVQILRAYVESNESAEPFAEMSTEAAAIAEIVPEIRNRVRLPELSQLEPAQARFRLFEGVTNFFRNTSLRRPLLLILDDLHWADAPSLRLLVFLAGELRAMRILAVGTYRDIALGRHHPLAQTLGDLARRGAAERIPLAGLSQDDVSRFIEISTGVTPSETLVRSVYSQTEGNPFFVSETVKLMVSEGRLKGGEEIKSASVPLPHGVREVIGRRLDHLSEECNQALATASVLGQEFGLRELREVSDLGPDRLLDVLDEAIAARVIREMPQAPGQFSFSHGLIREVLYDELGVNRRVRLHRRAGMVLEKLHAFDVDEHCVELARHFLQSAVAGEVDKAIAYSVSAGRRALEQLAYEEAVGHFERAVEALETYKQSDDLLRCELLLALGDARKKASEIGKSREAFLRAADCARRMGDPESLAQAALGLSGPVTGAIGAVDDTQLRLLNEALAGLPPQDSAIRATVLAQLSVALYYAPDRREPLSLEAVEMARRVGDPAALLTALYCRHIALVLTDDLEERRRAGLEMLRIAERAGAKETVVRAWYRLAVDAMEIGDMNALDTAIDGVARTAGELRQPAYLWLVPFLRGNRALLQGRFAECERLAQEALAIATRVEDRAAFLFLASQMTVLRNEQGRSEEQLQPVETYIQKYPMVPGHRATLAYLYTQLQRPEDARRELDLAAANDLVNLPRDGSWIVVLSMLATVCWYLNDVRLAGVIYPLLLRYASRNAVTGNAGVGCGSVHLPLGFLSACLSRQDEAILHFEQAILMNGRMGAPGLEANAKHELSLALAARGAPGDRERAKRLREEALQVAQVLGARGLERRMELSWAQAS